MSPTEYIELTEGISLTDEKVLIHPSKLIKLMNGYAEHRIREAKAFEVVKYSFTGRDINDAIVIKEAFEAYSKGNKDQAYRILVKSNWSLLEAKKYCSKYFEPNELTTL